MEWLVEVRTVATAFAFIGIGLHLALAWRVVSHRKMFAVPNLILAYAVTAALTLAASAVRRLQDRFHDQPLHLGDVLGLVPIVGFFVVGLYGSYLVGRHIGIVESKQKVNEVTANVTYLEVRKLA